jgi:hypothetical protein
MFRNHKKIDLVFVVFGAIALFVIISVSVILYLLFNKYSIRDNAENYSSNDFVINQDVDIKLQISPEELKNNYKKSVNVEIEFVQDSKLDIISLSKELEKHLLEIRVPSEEREKFLDATLQILRMQRTDVAVDTSASKEKILQILNKLLS